MELQEWYFPLIDVLASDYSSKTVFRGVITPHYMRAKYQACLHYKLLTSSLSTMKTVFDACWHSEIKCDCEQKRYSEVNWNET